MTKGDAWKEVSPATTAAPGQKLWLSCHCGYQALAEPIEFAGQHHCCGSASPFDARRAESGRHIAADIAGFNSQKKLVTTDLTLEIRPRAGQARS